MENYLYKALLIAIHAHKGQIDKAGEDYINHPVFLALQMTDEDSKVTALLHDVLEDSNITLEDLKNQGFSEQVLTALQYLTHENKMPYMDYIKQIRENTLARKVKIMDLMHNMDISRIQNPTEKDYKRIEKYQKAIKILQ